MIMIMWTTNMMYNLPHPSRYIDEVQVDKSSRHDQLYKCTIKGAIHTELDVHIIMIMYMNKCY